jgi:hypothetical protein
LKLCLKAAAFDMAVRQEGYDTMIVAFGFWNYQRLIGRRVQPHGKNVL